MIVKNAVEGSFILFSADRLDILLGERKTLSGGGISGLGDGMRTLCFDEAIPYPLIDTFRSNVKDTWIGRIEEPYYGGLEGPTG